MGTLEQLSKRDIELILECLALRKSILINDFSIYDTNDVKSFLGKKIQRILNIESILSVYKNSEAVDG